MIELFKKGIGDNNEFASYHPVVIFLYFAIITGVTMSVASVGILIISFVSAWIYSILLKGAKTIKFNATISLVIMLFTTFINTFFTHDGETVLFYINANRITMEAAIFGIFSGIVIAAIIIWFSCFNEIVTSEMIMYIFSRVSSFMGLMVSMIMRYIPLLKSRYEEISMGQKCICSDNPKGIVAKVRLITKKISILISWSLESSIESADSMSARGYGLKGRSSFHLYKFSGRDITVGGAMIALLAVTLVFMVLGDTSIQFYPELIFPQIKIEVIAEGLAFIIIALFPIIIDIAEEFKWKKLELNS